VLGPKNVSLAGDIPIPPEGIVDEFDILPAEILRFLNQTEGPLFDLPPNYAQQAAEVLPIAQSLSDEMELWGDDKHDDLSIYHNRREVFSIEARIDVRKLDSVLLSGLLALADSWSCTLVETRYRKVCRMGLEDFRAFLSGHPHCRP